MRFSQTILPNGLEVVAECHDSAYSASLGFFVKTGSRDEDEKLAGVSHFLEHLVFKVTENQTAQDINRRFDEIGASANAFTCEEETVYYASVLPELLEETLELYAGLLRPALREEDFETEKQVILEEIGMYEDQPPFGADEKCRELFYPDHPLGKSVLGTIASIERLRLPEIREYFQERYRPENILLVGCGKIDFDRFVEKAEACCGDWVPVDQTTARPERLLSRTRGSRTQHHLQKDSATLQYVIQLVDGPCGSDPDRYAAELAANILGDDSGSRLYWELVDPGWVDSLGLNLYEFLDNGFFLTGMSCPPELAEKNLERIRKVYRKAIREGISEEELHRAKSKVSSRIVLGNESPKGRLFAVGNEWVTRNRYRTVREDVDDIQLVSLAEIQEVLRKYPLTEPFMLSLGPEKAAP